MRLQYDNRHTFFISVGIFTLIFGLYPFYFQGVYEYSIKVVVHTLSIILAIYFLKKGLSLWKEKDKDKKEITEFLKEEMKRGNELKEIELERQRLMIDKERYSFDKEMLNKEVEDKKQQKKEVETEIENKKKKVDELKSEIVKKENELINKEKKIYEERLGSINQLPSSAFASGTTMSLFSGTTTASFSDVLICNQKKCSQCGSYFQQDPGTFTYRDRCKNCESKYPFFWRGSY